MTNPSDQAPDIVAQILNAAMEDLREREKKVTAADLEAMRQLRARQVYEAQLRHSTRGSATTPRV